MTHTAQSIAAGALAAYHAKQLLPQVFPHTKNLTPDYVITSRGKTGYCGIGAVMTPEERQAALEYQRGYDYVDVQVLYDNDLFPMTGDIKTVLQIQMLHDTWNRERTPQSEQDFVNFITRHAQ
jgi:hypothetical protein